MKTAIAVWQDRISPVFDVTKKLLIAEKYNENSIGTFSERIINIDSHAERVQLLNTLNINVLICGAISSPLAQIINNTGIKLIAFTAGNAEDVYKAFLKGELPSAQYSMPGCGKRKRARRRRNNNKSY